MSEIIASTAQQASYGSVVTLYEIDATKIGGDIFRFINGKYDGELVQFDGKPYASIPVKITGLAWSGKGAIPSPRLEASNIDGQLITALLNSKNLVGATATIIKTFEQFLDNGKNPDPTARFPDEIFTIDQLNKYNNQMVSWTLRAAFDVRDVKLPARQVLRDSCTYRYRRFANGGFDYAGVDCPYVGTDSFDITNSLTNNENDECNRNLKACQIRFGETPLPFNGFPGAARIRNRV